jgi:hypothetical protein
VFETQKVSGNSGLISKAVMDCFSVRKNAAHTNLQPGFCNWFQRSAN